MSFLGNTVLAVFSRSDVSPFALVVEFVSGSAELIYLALCGGTELQNLSKIRGISFCDYSND